MRSVKVTDILRKWEEYNYVPAQLHVMLLLMYIYLFTKIHSEINNTGIILVATMLI